MTSANDGAERPTLEEVRARLALECPQALVEEGVPVASRAEAPRVKAVPAPRGSNPDRAQAMRRGRVRAAENGWKPGAPTPYGYRREGRGLVPDPLEAEVVRLVFREYLRLRSMGRVLALLAAQGTLTRKGRAWSSAGLAWILRNATYVGRIRYGAISTRGRHPALVASIVFYKAGALMRANDKRRRARAAERAE